MLVDGHLFQANPVVFLSTTLQMGANSSAAGVSSLPADHQSASSQPPFANVSQVRSDVDVLCSSCMLHYSFARYVLIRLFTDSVYLEGSFYLQL